VSKQSDETALMERAARGDASAFSELYHQYGHRVYNFAYRMLSVESVAEDVTHEAFLVLIEHPEQYRSERGSVLTFLCAIARHQIFRLFRRRGYEVESEFGDDSKQTGRPDESEQDPLTILLGQELAAEVAAAIGELSPLQREAIVLREFQELSYEEIARVTCADVSVVKVRLYRARQSLSRRLAPYLNSEREECNELR
jgi:RNA polymerase sigma-70 factor (ECF subfamily)